MFAKWSDSGGLGLQETGGVVSRSSPRVQSRVP